MASWRSLPWIIFYLHAIDLRACSVASRACTCKLLSLSRWTKSDSSQQNCWTQIWTTQLGSICWDSREMAARVHTLFCTDKFPLNVRRISIWLLKVSYSATHGWDTSTEIPTSDPRSFPIKPFLSHVLFVYFQSLHLICNKVEYVGIGRVVCQAQEASSSCGCPLSRKVRFWPFEKNGIHFSYLAFLFIVRQTPLTEILVSPCLYVTWI